MNIPTWQETPKMVLTFILATIGWIIFRADSIENAWQYMVTMCNSSLFSIPFLINRQWYIPLFITLVILFVVEWLGRDNGGILLAAQMPRSRVIRWGGYLILVVLIYFFGNFSYNQFIYFQF